MKKPLYITIFLFLLNSLISYGAPILVVDGSTNSQLPKNFRTTAGLNSLHAIGSGEFTIPQLKQVINKIKHPIIVIDLRQESHGFINDLPVSWYGPKNWANKGKTPKQINKIETDLLKKVGSKKQIFVCTKLKKSATGIPSCNKYALVKVKSFSTEKQLVESMGAKYYRIYVTDRSAPTMQQVEKFARLVKTIPDNTWLYFHCRAGKGRTTTFMVLYDIIKNAKTMSLNAILAREYKIGGKNLTKIPQHGYERPLSLQRLMFIKKFYRQSHDSTLLKPSNS